MPSILNQFIAAGSSVSDATKIDNMSDICIITTTPASSGIALPFCLIPGKRILIQNSGANTLAIYSTQSSGSTGSSSINGSASIPLNSNSSLEVVCLNGLIWVAFRPS